MSGGGDDDDDESLGEASGSVANAGSNIGTVMTGIEELVSAGTRVADLKLKPLSLALKHKSTLCSVPGRRVEVNSSS